MKLLLLVSVICFAAVLAAPADKPKREILPGDPRYGTDQHPHHHQHHEHENEVQISKAIGGYVGSFSVPDTEVQKDSFQVPKPTYGPPSHKPGNLINGDYVAPNNIKDVIQVPSTSYGVPDTIQLNNNYVEDKKTPLVKVTIPKTDVRLNTDLNIDYHAPLAEAPITSYGVPDIKTTISEQPKFNAVQKSIVSLPPVKVTTKLGETQGFTQQSISTGSLPSFTSFNTGSSLLPSVYTSYPINYPTSYQSIGSIPVKTIDHHVHVKVPQPYPVPVTKQVTYPVPVPHTVEVPKPYHVRVPYPVQVPVNRPYPVEVPRAVPYPVPHYIRTSVPVPQPVLHVQQQHHVVDTTKANPIQTFFEDTIGNLPSLPSFTNPFENFQNPFENFQNPFDNFQIPSLPSFTPAQPSPSPAAPAAPVNLPIGSQDIGVSAPTGSDSVTIENPTIKTAITKTSSVIAPIPNHPIPNHPIATQPIVTQPIHTAKATIQKEYVQQTDANGGYVY